MVALDIAVKELRQILASPRTSPEWRWHAHRRLVAARAAWGPAAARPGMIPAQPTPQRRDAQLQRRLEALSGDVLDRLGAGAFEREVEGLLVDLEQLQQRFS